VFDNRDYATITDKRVAEQGLNTMQKIAQNKARAKGVSGKQVNSAQRVRQLRMKSTRVIMI
jgi:hypothetical protein